jgi:MYXO-CTERM domain-containing protein
MDLRLLTVAIALAACGCASRVEVSPAPIVGGTSDTHDDAVGALVTWAPTCAIAPNVVCTAVLVAPRVAVTAGHCIDDLRSARAAVFFGPDLAGPGTYVAVARAMAHPSFDPDTRNYDVGVLVLASAASPTPIAIDGPPISDAAIGATLRAVGYGITSADDFDYVTAGVRREGTMSLTSVTATDFASGPAPAMTCRIDSGGPVLATIAGSESLVGITAGGDAACLASARNVRLDVVRDFVVTIIAEVASEPARPAPDAVRLAALCMAACASDDDCPLSLSCQPTEAGPRCMQGPSAGAFAATCDTDRDCPGTSCVRLEAAGAAPCRCFAPCFGGPPPPPDAGPAVGPDAAITVVHGGGCSCGIAGRSGRGISVLGVLGMLGFVLRRRRTHSLG